MDHAFARLVEENGAEFLLAMGRAAGGEERREAHIHWIIGGAPVAYNNAVVRAALPPELLDEEIAASRVYMEKYGVPGSWHVGPAMRADCPGSDLDRALIQHGFRPGGDDTAMALDFAHLPHRVNTPPGFSVQRVQNPAQFEQWRAVLADGFGEGPQEANWAAETFARIGYANLSPWQHFIGLLGGRPVGTATLFLHSGVAGVYFVCTAPQARRQGIGAALTLAALHAARDLGYYVGVLGASEQGVSVYRRLGFREVGTIAVYEWGDG